MFWCRLGEVLALLYFASVLSPLPSCVRLDRVPYASVLVELRFASALVGSVSLPFYLRFHLCFRLGGFASILPPL